MHSPRYPTQQKFPHSDKTVSENKIWLRATALIANLHHNGHLVRLLLQTKIPRLNKSQAYHRNHHRYLGDSGQCRILSGPETAICDLLTQQLHGYE